MLHRAILGSFERFIGVLIEHYAGAFPSWLAPEQVVVMNITDKQKEYCSRVVSILAEKGFRVSADLRNEKVGFKIREHTLQKIPYLLVVGDKEVSDESVSVRTLEGEDLGVMRIGDFCDHLGHDVAHFGRRSTSVDS
jgi:threonyl-tRNA synthetase